MDLRDQEIALLRSVAALINLDLSDEQVDQLFGLRTALIEYNQRINLTSIEDPHEILIKHIIDSATCLWGTEDQQGYDAIRMIDVGSGGGFPGLVLAILKPQWQVVLLEATAKKIRFHEEVIERLHLPNVLPTHGRAEVFGHEAGWRASFGLVTARAVAALPTLLEWCQPFARNGGLIIAPKKGDINDPASEISQELERGTRASRVLQGSQPEIVPLPETLVKLVPELGDQRFLVRVRQTGIVPARYPRSGATPVRAPLG